MKAFINSKKIYISSILALLLFAALMRIYQIGSLPYWRDESFSILLSSKDISQIISLTIKDTNPPLHQILLHYWMQIFGTSETATRFLSFLPSFGTVLYFFLIAKKLFGKRMALVALALFLVNFVSIYYAREVRAYSLLTFFLTASSYYFLLLIEKVTTKNAILYILTSTFAFYTHNTALFFFAAEISFLIVRQIPHVNIRTLTKTINDNKTKILKWIVIYGIIGVLIFPWLLVLSTQAKTVQSGFWLGFDPVNSLNETLTGLAVGIRLFSSEPFTLLNSILNLAIIGLALLGTSFELLNFKKIRIPICIFFWIPLLLIYFISFKSPLLYIRYVSFLSPFMTLLVLRGITALTKRKAVIISIVLALILLQAKIYFSSYLTDKNSKPHTNELVSYVEEHLQTGDTVINKDALSFFCFTLYSKGNPPSTILDPEYSTPFYVGSVLLTEENFTRSLTELTQFDRVWVVALDGGMPEESLGSQYSLTEERKFDGNLNLQLFTNEATSHSNSYI